MYSFELRFAVNVLNEFVVEVLKEFVLLDEEDWLILVQLSVSFSKN